MASFVDASDYLAYYNLGGDDMYRAEVDLDAACDRIRDYLGQTVDLVTGDVVTVAGTGTRALTLPELPVVSVASITDDGTAVTDWTVDEYGIVWRTDPYWWPRGHDYEITYTHGYAPADVPAILKVAAFKLARLEGLGTGVRQESAGPFSVTYESPEQVLAVLAQRVVKRVAVP
jgi:hypothetical protein